MFAHKRIRRWMGYYATCCLVVALSTSAGRAQPAFRGFWADAFHTGFKSTSQIDDMVQRAVNGNYNAIVAEVLAYQDNVGGGHGAYWNSAIVPKATDISGGIDPLAYLCQQAHAQGIEVHAWLVTYRVSTSWPPNGNSTLSGHPEYLMVPRANIGTVVSIDGTYTLDPGSPDVQNYLLGIVRELVTNYEIDGINWDYVRYTQTDAGYPSNTSYYYSGLKRFQRITGRSDVPSTTDSQWSSFRRRTINELVRRCRAEIPSITSNPRQPLRLTADLFATGNAPVSFSSSSAYLYFQDWRLWMENGWLDAGMPMNYKREHCSDQAIWYRNWVDAAIGWRYQRHMYCGQATYLNSMANSIIQMQYVYGAGADGSVNYSYVGTAAAETECDGSDEWVSDYSWYTYVSDNLFTSPVPTPTMPWRDPATATEGTIWGRVINWDTGDAVDDAAVQIGALPAVRTDGSGYYVVTLVPAVAAGTPYTISITASGQPSASHPQAYVLAGDVTRYDFSLGAPAGLMGVTPASLDRAIQVGENLPDDTFTVAALGMPGRAPVNYFVSADANWLSFVPVQGSSSGEVDTITINYDTAGLTMGFYTATVTVADAAASNSPRTLVINLSVAPPPVPGDFDGDWDVDQDDFGHIQVCLSGSSTPQDDPDCQDAKLDGDGDVDGDDAAAFIRCMSGTDVPGNPSCLD